MKKKQLFLAVQAALFTFAVGNATAVEDSTESMVVDDETVSNSNKVDICHNGHTINIAQAAVDAHLAHGDAEEACSTSEEEDDDEEVSTDEDEELAVLECADGHTVTVPQADLAASLDDPEAVCLTLEVDEEFGEETTDVDVDIDIDVDVNVGTTIEGYILDSAGNPLSNLIVAISAISVVGIVDDDDSSSDDSCVVVDDDDSGSKAKDDDDSGSKAKDDDDSGSKAKDDDDSGSKAKDDDDDSKSGKKDDDSGSGKRSKGKKDDDDSGSKAKDDDSGSKAKDDDSGSKAKDDDVVIDVSCTDDDSSSDDEDIAIMVRTDASGFYQIVVLELGVYAITVSQEIELGASGNIALIEVGSFTVQVTEQGSLQVPEFEIPLVNELPEGELLEDLTIVGRPEEPLVIENREIHGTVHLSFATIVNVNIGMGAHLMLGRGARFRHHSAIPFGLRLTNIFRPIVPIAVIRGEVQQETTVVDLSEAVVENAPPVLEDVAAILNEGYEEENTVLVQDSETGHLEINIGNITYAVVPIEVRQAAEDVVPGVHFNPMNGTISFVTLRRQEVITYSAVQSMTDFVTGLADIGLFRLSMDMNGYMSAVDPVTHIRYRGRSEFLSELIEESVQEGVYTPAGTRFVHFVFRGRGNGLRRQIIYPIPADLEALTSENTNVENVEVQSTGFVSFSLQGVNHRGILSYEVEEGEVPESGGTEFVVAEEGGFTIIYPNGDRQMLIVQ